MSRSPAKRGTAGEPEPLNQFSINRSFTLDERIEELKSAYCDDVISVEELERDLKFVFGGGYFAGSYRHYIAASRETEVLKGHPGDSLVYGRDTE